MKAVSTNYENKETQQPSFYLLSDSNSSSCFEEVSIKYCFFIKLKINAKYIL